MTYQQCVINTSGLCTRWDHDHHTVVLQPDALPVKPVSDPEAFAEQSTSLVGPAFTEEMAKRYPGVVTILENERKAQAWDA